MRLISVCTVYTKNNNNKYLQRNALPGELCQLCGEMLLSHRGPDDTLFAVQCICCGTVVHRFCSPPVGWECVDCIVGDD